MMASDFVKIVLWGWIKRLLAGPQQLRERGWDFDGLSHPTRTMQLSRIAKYGVWRTISGGGIIGAESIEAIPIDFSFV
jgi:hypothetical protein